MDRNSPVLEGFLTFTNRWKFEKSYPGRLNSSSQNCGKKYKFLDMDFIRDVASLNQVELLPWDCWGIIENPEESDPDDLLFLDHLAELTSGDVPDFETVRNLYQSDARLHMGRSDPQLFRYRDGDSPDPSVAAPSRASRQVRWSALSMVQLFQS